MGLVGMFSLSRNSDMFVTSTSSLLLFRSLQQNIKMSSFYFTSVQNAMLLFLLRRIMLNFHKVQNKIKKFIKKLEVKTQIKVSRTCQCFGLHLCNVHCPLSYAYICRYGVCK
jgi:hypothetical protein